MAHLLSEAKWTLYKNNKNEKDVLWVGIRNKYKSTWDEFEKKADILYNNIALKKEINRDLVIVGKDFWLERNEIGNLDCWSYKCYPAEPEVISDLIVSNSILDFIKECDLISSYHNKDILTHIRESYINDMITNEENIQKELLFIADIIMEYLLKIYYWSDLVKGTSDFWAEQIFKTYHDIPKQLNNQFPSINFIKNTIWDLYTDEDALNYQLCESYKDELGYENLPKIIVDLNGLNFAQLYFSWLAEKLSKKGNVDLNEVKNIINNLKRRNK